MHKQTQSFWMGVDENPQFFFCTSNFSLGRHTLFVKSIDRPTLSFEGIDDIHRSDRLAM
jgi:hypothetical protein